MEKTIAIIVGSLLIGTMPAAEDWRPVTNEQYHYRVNFPTAWAVWKGKNGALSATSYPKNRAPEGGLVPDGEAAIEILHHKGEPLTLNRWIEESLTSSEVVRQRKVVLQPGHEGDLDSYTEVESRYDAAPGVYYRRLAAYFTFKGRLLVVQLEFKEGAAREVAFRSVLGQVVRSIVTLR